MKRNNKQMLTKGLALCAVSLLGVSGAFAQSACITVQQDGTKVNAVGSAWHTLDEQTGLTITCADGKVAVSNGSAVVASLSVVTGSDLVMEFGKDSTDNSLNCSVSSAGYSTLYSPFQLTVPTGSAVEVYAPTYENGKLLLTDDTRLEAGTVVAPETGLILKNEGSIALPFTGSAASTVNSALSGSSLTIPVPTVSGQTIYTLGHATDDASLFGFFKYSGSTLAAGKAYLAVSETSSAAKAFVPFSFDYDITGIHDASAASSSLHDGKYLEKGRLVIVKGGQKYNISGNRIY